MPDAIIAIIIVIIDVVDVAAAVVVRGCVIKKKE